jgi:phosphoribosylglycinamide formyltransferase 2
VIPTAQAARLTMHREGIRRLAAEQLGLPTSPYVFADNLEDFTRAVHTLGFPCVVKPVMSSSGKGQSVVKREADLEHAWSYAQAGGRAGAGRVIVEGFIAFDYEITLLTVRHVQDGQIVTSYCEPIGHLQIDGDYRESWQPQPMSRAALEHSQRIAHAITEALGGQGIFGVELFIKGDEVWFSEVSPRPHDTGLVTLISQNLSEFALHARAILGLPIPAIRSHGVAASCALVVQGNSSAMSYGNLAAALQAEGTDLKLFGKPEVRGSRRLGVGLALGGPGTDIEAVRQKARAVVSAVEVRL